MRFNDINGIMKRKAQAESYLFYSSSLLGRTYIRLRLLLRQCLSSSLHFCLYAALFYLQRENYLKSSDMPLAHPTNLNNYARFFSLHTKCKTSDCLQVVLTIYILNEMCKYGGTCVNLYMCISSPRNDKLYYLKQFKHFKIVSRK